MNAEIWRNLPGSAKVADLQQQQLQQTLSYALVAFSNIANVTAKRAIEIPKDVVAEILKGSIDCANLIGHQIQEINSKRRNEVKRFLNPEYGNICSSQVKILKTKLVK